jgi:hypothetical protein
MKRSVCFALFSIVLFMEAAAQGPTGLGALKLGMTKEGIESLQVTDGVYLDSPMSPYKYRRETPKEGVDIFIAKLVTPLRAEPIEAVLTFESSQLTELYMKLTDNTFDRIKGQIVEKYGAGKVNDRMKEEQCIYKNGSSFKVTGGAVSITWNQGSIPSDQIETKLQEIVIAPCPSSLRETLININSKCLSVRRANSPVEVKSKNLF